MEVSAEHVTPESDANTVVSVEAPRPLAIAQTVKIDLRINGRYEIELAPESELERLMLSEMAERANKGRPVSFVVREENHCRVGVDK